MARIAARKIWWWCYGQLQVQRSYRHHFINVNNLNTIDLCQLHPYPKVQILLTRQYIPPWGSTCGKLLPFRTKTWCWLSLLEIFHVLVPVHFHATMFGINAQLQVNKYNIFAKLQYLQYTFMCTYTWIWHFVCKLRLGVKDSIKQHTCPVQKRFHINYIPRNKTKVAVCHYKKKLPIFSQTYW